MLFRRIVFIFILFLGTPTFLQGQSFFSSQLTTGNDSYRTLRTRNFRIHYPEGRRNHALRIAGIAERLFEDLDKRYRSGFYLGDIILVYDNDTVNAYANVMGRDQVVLFMNNPNLGPSGGSGWSRFDFWAEELLIHEFTHILSLRYMGRGLTWNRLIRIVAGIPGNVVSPYGMVEGIAVYEESQTGRGRLNDPVTHMIFRTAVLENEVPDAAEIMNGSHRWPGGNMYYLYGGAFVDYIHRNYGDHRIPLYYRVDAIPFLHNYKLRRVGLKSYNRMYNEFRKDLNQVHRDKIKEIRERGGITPYERLTYDGGYKAFLLAESEGGLLYHHGRINKISGIYQWMPEENDAFHANSGDESEKVEKPETWYETEYYIEDDDDPDDSDHENKGDIERVKRLSSSAGLASGGGVRVFSEDYFEYAGFGMRYELYDGNGTWFADRLHPEKSALFPALSRDGRSLYFIERSDTTKKLRYAGMDPDGEIKEESLRTILEVPDSGILQYASASPDGKQVVALVRPGDQGPADMVLCDRNDGIKDSCRVLLKSHAAMIHPRFSDDGRWIYFSSHPDDVFNIYRVDPSTGNVTRLTESLTGFFYPAPAKNYLYTLGYFKEGYDLVRFRYEDLAEKPAEGFLAPVAATVDYSSFLNQEPEEEKVPRGWKDSPYSAISSLSPYLNGIVNVYATQGYSLYNLGLILEDPLNRHFAIAYAGSSTYGPEAYVHYEYNRYDVNFTTTFFTNYEPGKRGPECWFDENTLEGYLACPTRIPMREDGDLHFRYISQGRYFSYQMLFGGVHHKIRNADRYSVVQWNARDLNLTGPSFLFVIGDSHYYHESISNEDGWSLYLQTEYYTEGNSSKSDTATDFRHVDFGVAEGGATLYLPSFFENHVNYLGVQASASYGPDRELREVSLGYLARGYNPLRAPSGTTAVVFTYEYRFPVIWISRAVDDDMPEIMVRQFDMALFMDLGGVTSQDKFYREDFRPAYGARVNVGTNLSFFRIPLQFTLSVARGTGQGKETRVTFAIVGGSPGPVSETYEHGRVTDIPRAAIPYRTPHPVMREMDRSSRLMTDGLF